MNIHIQDITITIHPGMLVWPKDPAPVFETIQTIERDGNETTLIHINSHTGTHIDAPKHFVKGGGSVDGIDPAIFVGPCEVVKMPEDIKKIKKAKRVLFRTSNSDKKLLHRKEFFEDFAALTPDDADFLIAAGVKLVGVDYLSCENPCLPAGMAKSSPYWQVHKKLLSAGVVIVEGCDLSQTSPGAYQLVVLPLKLKGLDGSPCRALLITP